MSDKYSNKDFTGHDLSSNKDMNNIIIENSCFSQETPNSNIFPSDMKGTTFVDCNLDNCFIPNGNQVIRGSNKSFKCQNDGEDWVVDSNSLKPIEPINVKLFLQKGLSIDPVDIPEQPLEKSIIEIEKEKEAEALAENIAAVEAANPGDIIVVKGAE